MALSDDVEKAVKDITDVLADSEEQSTLLTD